MEAVKFEACHERVTHNWVRNTAEELPNKADPARRS
jgi:hypothetical protein